MLPGGLGPLELSLILVIVLVIFGAKKLPQIGEGMGKAIRNFKTGISSDKDTEEKKDPEKIEDNNKA